MIFLDAACVRPRPTHDAAFHRGVTPVVTTFAESCWARPHLARTDSRT